MFAEDHVKYNILDSGGQPRRISGVDKQEPHIVRKHANDFVWKLWFIAMKTRSEGMHGDLCQNGKSIAGKSIGDEKVIDNVVYVWHGEYAGRKNTFDASGWIPKEDSEFLDSGLLIRNSLNELNK